MKESDIRMKRIYRLLLQFLPGIIGGLVVIWLFLTGSQIEPEDIAQYAPRQPLLAALAMLGLYGVKSISVFLPMLPLQLAVGFLFPPAAAVLINTLGYALGAVISYYRGRSAGDETIEQLMGRYPRLCAFVRGNESGNLFLSFILRVIGMVPMDVSSMYLGSTRVPFLPYLLATVAGALPKVAAITLVGDSITQPGSPAFLLSAAFTAALTLLSSLFFLWYRKKHRNQGADN